MTRSKAIGLGMFMLLCALLVMLFGCERTWRADSITSCLVDANDAAPLTGAVVMVDWQLTGLEGYPQAQLAVHEAVTDPKGCFRIPAWESETHVRGAVLKNAQPVVRILKKGYAPLTLDNFSFAKGAAGNWTPGQTMRPNIDGSRVSVSRFQGTLGEYAKALDVFWRQIPHLLITGSCERNRAPTFLSTLGGLAVEFHEAGIPTDLKNTNELCGRAP